MSNWISFVKKYRSDHPNLSWKAALKAASGPYKKQKTDDKRKGVKIPKLRGKKKKEGEYERRPNSCDCFHEKASMPKNAKKKVKHECGICERQALTPKKTRVLRKKKRKKRATSSSSKRQTEGSAKRKGRKLDL